MDWCSHLLILLEVLSLKHLWAEEVQLQAIQKKLCTPPRCSKCLVQNWDSAFTWTCHLQTHLTRCCLCLNTWCLLQLLDFFGRGDWVEEWMLELCRDCKVVWFLVSLNFILSASGQRSDLGGHTCAEWNKGRHHMTRISSNHLWSIGFLLVTPAPWVKISQFALSLSIQRV